MEPVAGETPPNDGLGVWLVPPERLREQAASAAALGIATQIHGIGDAAVRAALDALAPTVGATPLVPRVEHAQLVDDADVPRFAALGIAASMQPVHLRSDVGQGAPVVGAIARTARAFPLARPVPRRRPGRVRDRRPGRADRPVAGDRLRRDARGAVLAGRDRRRWGPSQAMSLWRAIRSACVDPAITAGEADRGRLLPGHRADVVVLPAAAVDEPVEVGGALWHARPRLVLWTGRSSPAADRGEGRVRADGSGFAAAGPGR